jgi:uncharacterized protein YndB with AHSA1/START domain
MSTWTATTVVDAPPREVLDLLTDPGAAARWSPVPFEVDGLGGDRLAAGARARLTGSLAGVRVGFDVEVHEAGPERLALSASGPIGMDVLYELRPEGRGSEVHASITIRPVRGLRGRMFATATDALLGAGALRTAVGRLAFEARPASAVPALCLA